MPERGHIFDVTVPGREGMPQWEGEEVYRSEPMLSTPDDDVNVTLVTITSHTGTHVDAPRHFIHDGKSLDDFPLDDWIGPAVVVDFAALDRDITADDLKSAGIPAGTTRLVLKTRNSNLWQTHPETFVEDYIALAPSGAEWLVERQVRLVANDYLSIGSVGPEGVETHLILLHNDILVVEGLNLSNVPAGAYELLCFPLRLSGGDGAPARVALRSLGE
jgi:arylformamidase